MIEAMADAEGAPKRGVDRHLGDAGLEVREPGVAGHVDPAVDLAVEGGTIERVILVVDEIAAAQCRSERMALPIGRDQELGRNGLEPRGVLFGMRPGLVS
jgi:hypothetical protein